MSAPTVQFWKRKRGVLLLAYVAALMISWLTTGLRAVRESDFPLGTAAEQHLVVTDRIDQTGHRILRTVCEPAEWQPVSFYGLHHPQSTHQNETFASLARVLASTSREHPVHLSANGHAGAVALHYAAAHPERIKSLTLINAHSVEELSLLGEYHLNHALYAISSFLLRSIDAGVPHFGRIPDLKLRIAQLRLLRNSDARDLRPLHASIDVPVLLLTDGQENRDELHAAEHSRLLPHSQYVMVSSPQEAAERIQAFHDAVEHNQLPRRAQAAPDRLEAAAEPFDATSIPKPEGSELWFILILIALATLITEDLTCILTGIMIANGNLSWLQGCGACLAGILLGDYLLYLSGRWFGRPALRKRPLRWFIDANKLRDAEEWFRQRGGIVILISRFLPGTRLPVYVIAGVMGLSPLRFTAWFAIAAAVWTPILVQLAVVVSDKALQWIDRYHQTTPAVLLGVVLLYLCLHFVLLPSFHWRGRRMLYGKWRRLTRPEYWPAPLLYWPIVLDLLSRGFRPGKSPFDFTACNPCMPASGVVEESKSQILDQFQNCEDIARYATIPASLSLARKIDIVERFQRQSTSSYPIVLKPDVGQRGSEVSIARTADDVRTALEHATGTFIVQEFAPGPEFGVFYLRHPEEETGRIFAITEKRFHQITGDGRSTLRDLLLRDDRAVSQFSVHETFLRDRLYTVPADGELVTLTDVGNHARGTLFLEGMQHCTPDLEAAVDRISKSMHNFHYGRYDIRVPSLEAFREGRNLKIIELNGATSEATSIYDPRYRYLHMVRTLRRQWRFASEYGEVCRAQGHAITGPGKLLRLYAAYRKRQTQ